MATTPTTRGRFIVIEGIDGAGSSTQTALLIEHLSSAGVRVVSRKEPTSGPAGALIRLALDRRLRGPNRAYHDGKGTSEPEDFDERALALLFAADRIDHVKGVIQPALEQGRWIVCDRYVLSSLAYQGSKLGIDWVASINRFALAADLTIYLDAPVDATQKRMRASRLTAERYESASEQEAVREGYRRAIPEYEKTFGPVRIISAESSPGGVALEVWAAVDGLRTKA